eukprot:CAMPEP_0174754404 /NCGR_PEP_ID=MMETSP1094-20130205/105719_1 /TAXON_ID=156173 /ORGANISM="Chrysochromulina brevifilum, Strain UTEX LB 985" /LENGTH=112 /DNA_ID=CAMNT_0015960269 /DNA_START=1023 /DNA_END=1365 /DNA_ORIENTATION=+
MPNLQGTLPLRIALPQPLHALPAVSPHAPASTLVRASAFCASTSASASAVLSLATAASLTVPPASTLCPLSIAGSTSALPASTSSSYSETATRQCFLLQIPVGVNYIRKDEA